MGSQFIQEGKKITVIHRCGKKMKKVGKWYKCNCKEWEHFHELTVHSVLRDDVEMRLK